MGVYDRPFWSKNFYDHKARWIHYFRQIRAVANEIRQKGGQIKNFWILEIGPSYGLVTFYLRKFGANVKTLDIKEEYQPDFLGSILAMPFENNSFDMILACEILEHLPFKDFPRALKELHRVTKETVLISLPDERRILLNLSFKLPFLKEIHFLFKIPTFKHHVFDGHYWEIGKIGYSVFKICQEIKKAGFKIRKRSTFYDTPKNHYFILEKS